MHSGIHDESVLVTLSTLWQDRLLVNHLSLPRSEDGKTRNGETLQILLQQNPASFKVLQGVSADSAIPRTNQFVVFSIVVNGPFFGVVPRNYNPKGERFLIASRFPTPSLACSFFSLRATVTGNPTFSLHKEITSPEVTHELHDSEGCNFLSEELLDIDSFNDIHPHFDDNPLSGSNTYSSNSFLEEFTDELALITYPPDYDDNLKCDIESDLIEIEFLLYQGEDSDFKDSIDQTDLANLDDLFVDPTPEMFTDEQSPDYSFPPRFDVYDDDFLEIESDADNFDDDSFDSKGEKIKESELLIDQLDLPCDIFPSSEYDSFNSQDFSKDDDLPSPDNEDKVFNPGILIQEKSVKIITRVAQEKKLAISFTSLVFEDFDPLFYELFVFKAVSNSMRLLLFSSENEKKVFKPGIYISEKVKENQEKDKIESKPDKNGKRGEAGKSQKQLQSIKKEKLKKIQKEGPKVQSLTSFISERRKRKTEIAITLKFQVKGP
nr:hypothetical protein [Tanacetum cinerariifolium]